MLARPKRPPMVLLVIAAVLVVGIGAALWRYSRFNTVYAVNGLPVSVDISLDGRKLTVQSNGRVTFTDVPVGTHVIEARWQGEELETTLVFVKGGSHELIYNVGGAAPLVWERIAYSKYSSDQEPQWRMYCGSRFVELESVDYVFSDPPKSISTKSGGTIYKTHLTLDQGGLKTCQSWALDKGSQEMWAEWQRLEARIDPKKALYAIEEYARQGDFRQAQLLLEEALAKEPTVELQRIDQSVLMASGQAEKARAKYGRSPDDAQAAETDLWLAQRLLPLEERLAFVDQALVRFPKSPWLLYARAQALDRRGDTAQALAAYELAEASPPKELEWSIIHGHLSALLRLKKYKEAWAAGQSAYKDSTSIDGAVTYANLAMLTGNAADWAAKLKAHQVKWANALLGIPEVGGLGMKGKEKELDPAAFKSARDIIRLTLEPGAPPPPPKPGKKGAPPMLIGAVDLSPPRVALVNAGRAADSVLRLLPDAVVWLLLTEAWRVGDTAAATRLAKHATNYDAPRLDAALRFIATGRLEPQVEMTGDLTLAVLWLARGRRLATLGESPKAAYAEARRLDAFHGMVWRALDRWPEAQAGAKLAWLPVD